MAQFGVIEYLSKQECNISLLIPRQFSPSETDLKMMQSLLPSVRIYTLETKKVDNQESLSEGISLKRLSLFFWKILSKVKNFYKKLISMRDINAQFEIEDGQNSPLDEFLDMYSMDRYLAHDKEYIDMINKILIQDSIDIVQLEFDENLSLIAMMPNHVKTIFVVHECCFSRIKTHISARSLESNFCSYIYKLFKCIEISFLEKFDGVITFQEGEATILRENLRSVENIPEIIVSPFPVLDSDFADLKKSDFSMPSKLVFIGWEEHYPNKDAIEWFLEETAEEIMNKFNLPLYVIGEWKLETIQKYQNHPSQVKFTGFVPDLHNLLKGSISVAPIRIGGGLRSKILLSMAQGIPVVATSYATEGMPIKQLEDLILANTKDEFCWAIDYLITDLDRTFKICQNAQNLIRVNYSQETIAEQRFNFFEKILSL